MLTISGTGASPVRRSLALGRRQLEDHLTRLATGTRISQAGDDPVARATSRRLEADARGRSQAIRNLNDGVSMMQLTDSALSEVQDRLQRARELAVQASQGTLTASDTAALTVELEELIDDIDDIGERTAYNGKQLLVGGTKSTGLGATEMTVLERLRKSWLSESEALISEYYGLDADGADMTVTISSIDGPYNTAAYVSGTIYPGAGTGFGENLQLVIDVDDYQIFGEEYDAIIAHEMVHAVMFRTINMYTTHDGVTAGSGSWFKEGTAEFLPGADERVAGTLTRHDSGEVTDRVVELLGGAAWGGGGAHGFSTADDYTAGYVAVRYLHDRITDAGGEGIKDVLGYMAANTGSGVDQALQNIDSGGYAAGLTDFATDFTSNGQAYIDAMDLTNEDNGGIGGLDADGGAVRSTTGSVPDTYDYEVQPLDGFALDWPLDNEISLESQNVTTIQSGGDKNQSIAITGHAIDRYALELDKVSFEDGASEAIGRLDRAIDLVSEAQSAVGATLTRLDSAISAQEGAVENVWAGYGRLADADFSVEAAAFAKAQTLQTVATQVLAQAGNIHASVVQTLLRG